jgi:integral membrane sensor domain MASE1
MTEYAKRELAEWATILVGGMIGGALSGAVVVWVLYAYHTI